MWGDIARRVFTLGLLFLVACDDKPLNDPHRQVEATSEKIRYMAFSGQPKTLDPARSYSADSTLFIAQIYEPPLQYHYLKRPYALEGLTSDGLPQVQFYDAHFEPLPADAPTEHVAYSVYEIRIKSGIYYQPHPAFAKDERGRLRFQHLPADAWQQFRKLSDVPFSGTRELKAADYVYQIKRLAHPGVQSPISGLMSRHILGLSDYITVLTKAYGQLASTEETFFDLRKFSLSGVEVIDDYTYRVTLLGKYPQFKYWLAMPFFAPIPWEADAFYSHPTLAQHNIGFDWYPVGTGPFYLTKNDPNREMVLTKNPNFHGEAYPHSGEPEDDRAGLLARAGQSMPFIDKAVYTLEVENIPRWSKFLQGYYDGASIASDSFDQAIQVSAEGIPDVTPELQQQNIQLNHSIDPAMYYLGFNMLNAVVGGYDPRHRYLRQAISIALDYEQYIAIFVNGRGILAQSPVPPGVFGHRQGAAGINPYVYDVVGGKAKRKSLDTARALMAQAGYPHGVDPMTGKPLILQLDVPSISAPDDKARFDWYRKSLRQLGIQLQVNSTHPNRFREKLQQGDMQLFSLGWLADYPDPENFLFLFYGPESKVFFGGENLSNYHQPSYDERFRQMKSLEDGPQRQTIIDEMIQQLQADAPLVWGYHPITYQLSHAWNQPMKASQLINNLLKYQDLDPNSRQRQQRRWNQPIWWPLWIIAAMAILLLVPLVLRYRRMEHNPRLRPPC